MLEMHCIMRPYIEGRLDRYRIGIPRELSEIRTQPVFCIAIYCNLQRWRDYYYHFFTYIHVLFSINVFKR